MTIKKQKGVNPKLVPEKTYDDTKELLEKEITESEKQELIKTLKEPDLLKRILTEFDKDHYSDTKQKLFTFLCVLTGQLKPIYRFSSALTGDTAEGKTNLWKTISKHLPREWFLDLTRITAACLEDDVKEFNSLYFGEGGANKNLIEQIKQFVEDGIDVMKKDTRKEFKESRRETQPRKVGIYSTTKNQNEAELSSRYAIVSVHGGPQKYQAVNLRTLNLAADIDKEIDFDERTTNQTWISKALRQLQYFDIILLPFAPVLEVNSKKSRSQRDLKRLLNVIRSIAWLHQYQRTQFEYREKKILVASPEDLYNALTISKEVFDQSLSGIEPRLQEVIDSYIKFQVAHSEQIIDNEAPDLNWVERNRIQEDLGLCRETIKDRCDELVDLGVFTKWGRPNRNYVAFVNNGLPTILPPKYPLITHDTKKIYDLVKINYPRFLKTAVVGTIVGNLSLDYVTSELFSPVDSLPTKNLENALYDDIKRQLAAENNDIDNENLKNRGSTSRVDQKPKLSLDEKLRSAIKIIDEKPNNNYDDVLSILGEDGINQAIKKGLFEEPLCGITLRYLGVS